MGLYDSARGERVPDDVLERLRGVTTATAWMYLSRKGVRRPFMMGVRPLSTGDVFPLVGRARTLRYVPLREDLLPLLREAGEANPQREAIEAVEPGDVFVVDGMGNLEAATLGDILASRHRRPRRGRHRGRRLRARLARHQAHARPRLHPRRPPRGEHQRAPALRRTTTSSSAAA